MARPPEEAEGEEGPRRRARGGRETEAGAVGTGSVAKGRAGARGGRGGGRPRGRPMAGPGSGLRWGRSMAGSGSRPRRDGARRRCSPGSGQARSGGRAGKGVPGPEAPHARGSMPGTAAPEVAGAGDGGGGGHGGAGGSGPFDPEVERPRRRPTIGRRPDGTKVAAILGGDAPAQSLAARGLEFPSAASSGAGSRRGHWREAPLCGLVSPSPTDGASTNGAQRKRCLPERWWYSG